MIEAKHEIDYLENVMTAIDTTIEAQNLDAIRDELVEQGYLKKKT